MKMKTAVGLGVAGGVAAGGFIGLGIGAWLQKRIANAEYLETVQQLNELDELENQAFGKHVDKDLDEATEVYYAVPIRGELRKEITKMNKSGKSWAEIKEITLSNLDLEEATDDFITGIYCEGEGGDEDEQEGESSGSSGD